MRIIAGSAKGRRLLSPKSKEIRPTLDRVREALFNILGESIVDAVFLDLFAGTGAVGIEALSRGAKLALFNDRSREAVTLFQENIRRSALYKQSQWFCKDAIALVKKNHAAEPLALSQIIFLDPPFDYTKHDRLFRELAKLPEQRLCILEHHAKMKMEAFSSYELFDQRVYGDTALSFFRPQSLRVMAIASPSISILR
jgi:16S rRNA (guanine966-N2)-methyltransferase